MLLHLYGSMHSTIKLSLQQSTLASELLHILLLEKLQQIRCRWVVSRP